MVYYGKDIPIDERAMELMPLEAVLLTVPPPPNWALTQTD
jgi:hypothetical protein